MNLTAIEVKQAKPKEKPYKMYDGNGLYLLVKPGGKYWRLKYRLHGKEKILAFGVYPMVSLADAREKAYQAKKQLTNNIDPSQEKKLAKLKSQLNSINSFEAIAKEWFENKKAGWSKRYADYLWRRLENDAFPKLGSRPITEIIAPELLLVIRDIEKRGALDIAGRIYQACGQVFRYAIATGRAERDISADLKGSLKTRKKTHYRSLPESELPEFLQKLEAYDGELQTKLGLKLILLTFVRTKELRGAKWTEIDLKEGVWKIPAERMKMKQTHIVPLSTQVVKLFEELKKINGHYEYCFPNRNNAKTFISENTLLYAIYRMGYHSHTTIHGFRSTASTILNENNFRADAIERQLAHGDKNQVRASYNHAQYLPERKEMMQWWANHISKFTHEW